MSPDPSLDPDRNGPLAPAPAAGPSETVDATADLTGDHIPNPAPPAGAPVIPGYEIHSLIARGGMGAVFAGRDLTLDREVAVKTLLPGADPDRFVTEAKITARLPHPGIPPVYALGTLPDGGYFLAMKLIRGDTLARLLKDRPSPADNLPRFVQVFEQIAQAVGYAHSRGVLHRDLKPLNVMVGEFGEVQVMDWGLAKDRANPGLASGGDRAADDGPEHTRAGQIMGTPGYMAPEQARGEVVDARADVFALGAVLAAVLTGGPAFVGSTARETIGKAAAADLADVLARLDACGADVELIALAKRCLAARVEDRPEDARRVADEVAAYRAGVEARLQRAETERAKALVREGEQRKRRRAMQWAGGVIAAVLLLGIAGTTIGMLRANAATEEARYSAVKEMAARVQLEKGVEQFAGLLTGIDPREEKLGGKPLYEQLRQRAEELAEQLDAGAVGSPLVVARLQMILSKTLINLGSPAKAAELLEKTRLIRERELGVDHPDTLHTLNNLAHAYEAAGRLPEAFALYEKIRDARVRTLGAEHPNTLYSIHNLAMAYYAARKFPDAIALYEQVREAFVRTLGAEHISTLGLFVNLAVVYQDAGRLPEAVALLEQVRDAFVRTLGPEHTDTLSMLNNLARAYHDAGKLPEAIALYEQVRDALVKKLGINHPKTLGTLVNLAVAYQDAGRLPEAIALLEQVRDARVRVSGAEHRDTLTALHHLAMAYKAAGRLPEAIALFEKVHSVQVKKLGTEHPNTLNTLKNLGTAYCEAGQGDKAAAALKEYIAGRRRHIPLNDVEFANILAQIALSLLNYGQHATAEEVLRECLTIREKVQPDIWTTFNTRSMLGGAFLGQKKYAEAEPLLLEGFQGMKAREKTITQGGTRIPEALDRLIDLYAALDKPDEVKKWRAERAKYPDIAPPPREKK